MNYRHSLVPFNPFPYSISIPGGFTPSAKNTMRFGNLRVTVGWRGCSIAYVIAEHVNRVLLTFEQGDTGCKRGDVEH